MKRRKSLIASAVALVIVAAAVSATAISAKPAKKHAGSIEVLSLWGGSEQAAFLKVTAAFTKATGIDVKYTSARDFIPDVRTRLAAGNPPDIGILPRPGYIATLANQGALKPLASLGLSNAYMRGQYSAGWLKLGSTGGKLYGVPAKANSKSVIWYKPDSFKKYKLKVPKTWAQLLAVTKAYKAKGLVPWSVGAGPQQSQWTLTDWFENIYARTAGPAKYQRLFTGKLPFTDPSVANAARIMTQIINNKYVLNGVQGVLGQSFVGGIADVFGTSPKAQLYFEGGFDFEYLNDPEKTAKSRDKHGWKTVGDIGYLDEDGYLYLTDRRHHMIISGGVNIYPQEAENVLACHPAVADVAVIGVPDEDMGEVVKAVVQPADPAAAGPGLEAELLAYCRAGLAAYKCPRYIVFAELPKTSTGKIQKFKLRDMAKAV